MSGLSSGAPPGLRLRRTQDGAALARIMCGFDGTESSVEAVRQAVLLRLEGSRLLCVAVCDRRWWPLPEEAAGALSWLEQAYERPDWLSTRLVEGAPAQTLANVAERLQATMLAVGAPRGGRMRGIVFAEVSTALLHDAPCSVLVARPWEDGRPDAVVVGVDGSAGSRDALALGRSIATALSVPLRPLVATGDGTVSAVEALELAPDAEIDDRAPVDALVGAASPSDLIVVGSRGTRGVAALGSVSERVAHEAACSVIVVRPGVEAPRRLVRAPSRDAQAPTVGSLMARDVPTVTEDRSVREVAALLLEGAAEVVAVVDAEGRLLGLVSADELLAVREARVTGTPLAWPHLAGEPVWSDVELVAMYRAAGTRTVGELARRTPVAVQEGDTLLRAAELMARYGRVRLPVMRGRQLVGAISVRELLRLAAGGADEPPP